MLTPTVVKVTDDEVTFQWDEYEIVIRLNRAPLILRHFYDNYESPPNEVIHRCYQIGYAILKKRKEKREKKQKQQKSFNGDLFGNEA